MLLAGPVLNVENVTLQRISGEPILITKLERDCDKTDCNGTIEQRVSLHDGYFNENCDRCDYFGNGFVSREELLKLRKGED